MTAPGFVMVPRSVLHSRALSGRAKVLYILLLSHDGREGCFPTIATLVDESGFNKTPVIRAIDELVAAGVVVRERRRFVNHYRFTDATEWNPSIASDSVGWNPSERRIPPGGQTDSTGDTDGFHRVDTNENNLTRITEREDVPETKTPGGAGGKAKPERPEVEAIFAYYRERIQPAARLIDAARQKISTRLGTFTADELKIGIDHFADDWWWMTKNGRRGAAWFFDSDKRTEQFLLLEPQAQQATENGHAASQQRVAHDRFAAFHKFG